MRCRLSSGRPAPRSRHRNRRLDAQSRATAQRQRLAHTLARRRAPDHNRRAGRDCPPDRHARRRSHVHSWNQLCVGNQLRRALQSAQSLRGSTHWTRTLQPTSRCERGALLLPRKSSRKSSARPGFSADESHEKSRKTVVPVFRCQLPSGSAWPDRGGHHHHRNIGGAGRVPPM